MSYCTIIPVKASDYYLVENVCKALFDKYPIYELTIITDKTRLEHEIDIPGVVTLDENEVYPGLTFNAVKELMSATDYLDPSYTGHCFQQLLKMAYCFKCNREGYLVWDADTIPLHEIPFYDEQTGITTFHMKSEFVQDYFTNLKTILDVDKQVDKSFISEHMYFDSEIMKEIIGRIANRSISGETWWEKIVLAMPCGNGVSEYEIYGNYVLKNYPSKSVLVDANSLRYGMNVLGKKLDNEKLEWVGKSFDCVSFENWDHETFLTGLSNAKWVKRIDAKTYATVISVINRGINHFRKR